MNDQTSSIEAGPLLNELGRPPEAHLWAAVLNLAILDAYPYIRGLTPDTYDQRKYGRAAFNWLLSEHHKPGSFSWVCELLMVDKMRVRTLIGVKTLNVW